MAKPEWVAAPALLVALLGMPPLAAPGSAQEAFENRVSPETVQQLLERKLEERFVPGEVIVKMKPVEGPGVASAPQIAQELGLRAADRATSGGETIFRIDVGPTPAADPEQLAQRTLAAVEDLRGRPEIEYAQPNYYLRIASSPNDTHFPLQWHYSTNGTGAGESPGGIGLPAAWDVSTGSANVVVAVIDTGILPNHPDITGSPNLVAGFDMISDTFVANDGDGRDSDATDPGDAVDAGDCGPGQPAEPDSWHGTHVAGTIGVGNTNNNLGVAGINWNVRVQPVRVLGRCGGLTTDINDAIRWAAGLPVPGVPNNTTPAKVINMSLGGFGACSNSPSLQSAIDDAVAAGVTVVVAAGNNAQNAANFNPSSCDGVITVAASDFRGRLVSRYSNFGSVVEILAPGGDVARDDNGDGNPDGVLSMVDGGYAFYNGTSMAAPHVAGVAALLLAKDPALTPAQVLARLQASALARSSVECPQPCGAGLLQADLGGGAVISVSPESLDLRREEEASLDVKVTDAAGAPIPGATVSFTVQSPSLVSVPSTALTNASGEIRVAVVAGNDPGETVVEVGALGATRTVPVKVPAIPLLALLVAALGMCLVLALRRGA